MTRTYTAADFANARFAELGKHGLRAHKSAGDSYWQRDGIKRATNEEMADAGWVPVPTKPTLTDSQLEEACGQWYESDDFLMGFMAGYEKAGGEIIPDPEPTNTERLVDWIAEAIHESGRFSVDFKEVKFIAKYLDRHGVKVEGK